MLLERGVALSALILLATLAGPVIDRESISSDLTLTVYRDGYVHVAHVLGINVTDPTISVALLGSNLENLLVTDQNGLPLDFSQIGSVVVIDSLGAAQALIEYDTPDLTSKSGRLWTLAVEAPCDFTITLPENSTVVDMSDVPLEIRSEEGCTILTLPSGRQEMSYLIGITTVLPEEPPTAAPEEPPTAAPEEPPTAAPEEPPTIAVTTYLVPILGFVALLAVVSLLAVAYLKRPRAKIKIDIDKVLERHPDLRRSDREVVRFIAEKGGEVLESDIREKFDLPKTTVWRLVKRIEKKGLVRVKRFGRQNCIQLKSA